MSSALFTKYLEGLLDAGVDWNTDDIRILALSSSAGKAITGATNATPISITCTGHGYSSGDIVMIKGVGGNTSANGVFAITNTGANTFTLQTLAGANVAGSGAYTSGGLVLNMTANDFKDDVNAAVIATSSAIAGPALTNGYADHADITFSAVPTGNNIEWFVWYKHTGTNSTSRLIMATDGWSTAPNPIPTNGGDVVLTLNVSGLFRLLNAS